LPVLRGRSQLVCVASTLEQATRTAVRSTQSEITC
jgi:hypothetical protein